MDIVAAELVDEIKELEAQICEQNEYKKAVEYTKSLEETQEKLIAEKSIPDRDVAKDISTTEMAIDIAMAALAKQTSYKLLKLEKFLSKIEDRLFNDETIAELSKSELMELYTATRMMKADAFRTLKEIKKEIDFEKLEADIIASNARGDFKNSNTEVNEVINKIMNSDSFLEKAIEAQLKEVEKDIEKKGKK